MQTFTVTFKGPFEIEETETKDFIVLKGCFLAEGLTKNGHYYEFDELKRIAKDIIGKPVNWGARLAETGGFKHLKEKVHQIGEVIEAWVDEAKKKIIGRVKVWNTSTFPRIVETIKKFGKAMGFSIGGKAKWLQPIMKNGLPVLTETGHGFLGKVIGMQVEHLQIIPPEIPRGQEQAKVEDLEETLQKIELVPIQETLNVNATLVFTYPRGAFRGITVG